MKKIFKGISRVVFSLLLIVSIFGAVNVLAEEVIFKITKIEVKEKSDKVTVNDVSLSGGLITNDIVFTDKDDFITYNITIKNNTSDKYKIKSITDDNTSTYLDYTYDDLTNVELDSGEEKTFNLTITYIQETTNLIISDQAVSLTLTYEKEDGTTGSETITNPDNDGTTNNDNTTTTGEVKGATETTVNPKTGDNITFYIILGIISVTGLVITTVSKKKLSKSLMAIALVSSIALPLGVRADSDKFNIVLNNIIKVKRFVVALEGSNVTFESNNVNINYGNETIVTVSPASGYYISEASCTNNYTITNLTTAQDATSQQTITINNNNQTTDSICTFTTKKVPGQFKEMILEDNPTIKTNPTLTESSDSAKENGLYKMSVTNGFGGKDGDTYFFRGNVTNNVVEFAGLTWRIVRINEDDTVRLILDTHIDTIKHRFNETDSNYDYMYYSNSGSIGDSSYPNVKYSLDQWYASNIENNSTYASKVVTGNYFCEAAKVKYSSDYTSGSATMSIYSSYIPTLDCIKDANDKQYVAEPVGLLTYDEVILAGGYYNVKNQSFYLYKSASGGENNFIWWTMSPAAVFNGRARAWYVSTSGEIYNFFVTGLDYLRPVINLRADVDVTRNEIGHYVVQ
ncbi:MAG: hypothetical protein J6O56_00665 [Bacilli bacterium]|nr:hypothetical protein [Bacilli bacterium]